MCQIMPMPVSALKALREFILAKQAAAASAPEQKMLQGVYRGYAGETGSPVVHYHGGTYIPDAETTRPLYMSRDKKMAESYADVKGGKVVALAPKPRKTASPQELTQLAAKYVPDNEYYGYTPASALDSELHNSNNVGDLINELWNREYDSARAMDVGMDRGLAGEVLIALPGENIAPAPTAPVFVSPQRSVGEYYANKRASQTGEDPHLEMLLVDPFTGEAYNHATMGSGAQSPLFTRARKLKPEDIQDRAQLYATGGLVTPEQLVDNILGACSCQTR